MYRYLLLLSFVLFSYNSVAQISSDPAAKVLLDEVSATTDALEAIHIVFEYHLNNSAENIQETAAGELTLKDNQYILSFMGIEQMSDGENVWTIMTDDEEVQISEIDLDDEGALTPSNLLKMYEKGFIYQMREKVGNLQMIELLPENPDDVDYIKIHLVIDTKTHQIKNLKQFGKDATQSEYIINNFAPSIIEDAAFIFNETDYPDFEIIDLR
jgi:hypothetical protein